MLTTPSEQFAALTEQLHTITSPWDRLPVLIELAMLINPDSPDYAYQCATEALSIAKELNDPFWTACSLSAIGVNLLKTSRYSEILFYLEQASEMFEQLNDARRKAETDCMIAKTYTAMRDIPKALPLLAEALNVFQSIGDRAWTVRALTLLGDIYEQRGEPSKAIKHYQRGLHMLRESELEGEMGNLYQCLASLYRHLGDATNHHRYLFKALETQQKHGTKGGIAVAMSSLANMYIDLKQIPQAIPYIEQSLKLYHELGFIAHEALAWGKLSHIYQQRGDIAGAFRCYRTGLALCLRSENKMAIGKMYETLGAFCFKAGRPHHCLRYFLKALSIFEELGDFLYLYQIHRLLGLLYEELGQHDKGLHHFKEFNRIKEEHAGINKCLQAGTTEQELETQELLQQIEREEMTRSTLEETIRKKETQLVSLTLELLRSQETQKKEKNGSATSTASSSDMLNTENWDIFARQFHKVHYGFYPDLLKRYPNLTPAEAKVCSLIRAGLSSKEIAAILCISKRTVDNHRAHINKKMGLLQGTSLSEFIAGI